MSRLADFDNTLGGSQIGQPYDGTGDYNPFMNQSLDGGGGGGGTYIPPVPPNPTFVPPSYGNENSGSLKIVLTSDEPVEFLESETTVGFGTSVTLNYNPSLTFGNSKIYKANLSTKISKNYWEVKVKRAHGSPIPADDIIPYNDVNNTSRGLMDNFNQNFNPLQNQNLNFTNIGPETYPLGFPTANDILYRQIITYQEFTYNEQT